MSEAGIYCDCCKDMFGAVCPNCGNEGAEIRLKPGEIVISRDKLQAAWEKHDIPYEGPLYSDLERELFGEKK